MATLLTCVLKMESRVESADSHGGTQELNGRSVRWPVLEFSLRTDPRSQDDINRAIIGASCALVRSSRWQGWGPGVETDFGGKLFTHILIGKCFTYL